MEPEDMSEEVEWECTRVMIAFEMTGRIDCFPHYAHVVTFGGWLGHDPEEPDTEEGTDDVLRIEWELAKTTGALLRLFVGGDDSSFVHTPSYTNNKLTFSWQGTRYGNVAQHALLARGLYRLGFEDETVLCQLPQLTAHEKLELRLSLPREFWPKRWMDEEAD